VPSRPPISSSTDAAKTRQGAAQGHAGLLQCYEGISVGNDQPFVVRGPSPIDSSVPDLSTEGVGGPLPSDGHRVQVWVEDQTWPLPASSQPGDEVHPGGLQTVPRDLLRGNHDRFRFKAKIGKSLGEERGDAHVIPRGVYTRDTHQFSQEVDHLRARPVQEGKDMSFVHAFHLLTECEAPRAAGDNSGASLD
jgi:hypothetical protein